MLNWLLQGNSKNSETEEKIGFLALPVAGLYTHTPGDFYARWLVSLTAGRRFPNTECSDCKPCCYFSLGLYFI